MLVHFYCFLLSYHFRLLSFFHSPLFPYHMPGWYLAEVAPPFLTLGMWFHPNHGPVSINLFYFSPLVLDSTPSHSLPITHEPSISNFNFNFNFNCNCFMSVHFFIFCLLAFSIVLAPFFFPPFYFLSGVRLQHSLVFYRLGWNSVNSHPLSSIGVAGSLESQSCFSHFSSCDRHSSRVSSISTYSIHLSNCHPQPCIVHLVSSFII